jgi:hypothetical protein
MHLILHVDELGVLALAQRERDGRDHRYHQDHGGYLHRVQVLRVEQDAQQLGVGPLRDGALRDSRHLAEAAHQHISHLERDHDADKGGQREVLPEPLPETVDVEVEHHHNEQEQHHHCAEVHQHQHDGQKLGLQQQPHGRRLRERKHQVQHRVHGVARGDYPEGCKQQHDREQVEEASLDVHGFFL